MHHRFALVRICHRFVMRLRTPSHFNRTFHSHSRFQIPSLLPIHWKSRSRFGVHLWSYHPSRNNSNLSLHSANGEKPDVAVRMNEYKRNLRTEHEDWNLMLKEGLNEEGIYLPRYDPGHYRILCPKCDGGSTSEISLSVTIDEAQQCALYHCFRAKCGWSGHVGTHVDFNAFEKFKKSKDRVEKPNPQFQPLDAECLQFFKLRGISESVLERNGVQMEMKGNTKYVAFPYYLNGELVNVKYRGVHTKEFRQVKGAMKVWYGLDDVKTSKEIIIVEGEMDKLALETAGYTNVLSVPDGAPSKVKDQTSNTEDVKFSYITSGSDVFEQATKIILATDNDESGFALAEELSRRLGVWKCWKVRWPSKYVETMTSTEADEPSFELRADDGNWIRKDANEVLMKDGAEILSAYIDDSEPYPVSGLLRFMDFFDEIRDRYVLKTLCPSGFSIGWPGVDRYYKVVPGELTIVSGVPNSGKSEWLDAVAVKLAEQYGWTIAFSSMEKMGWDHGRQLIEKHIGKPFYSNVHYAGSVPRMSADEVQQGLEWINDKFPLIKRQDDELPTIDWILEKAKAAVLRFGIRGLIIDPYNELDHGRNQRTSETEFVSGMLSRIKSFARNYDVHVWLVAHPRQLHDWRGEPPTLYDISGSAHFINKADAGIVVHRNWKNSDKKGQDSEDGSEDDQFLVSIIVKKMRNKAAGRVGTHVLRYNPVDGTYSDPEQKKSPPIKTQVVNGVQNHS